MIEASRRGFLTGLIAFGVTAPAIVRAASIMPVKVYERIDVGVLTRLLNERLERAQALMEKAVKEWADQTIYSGNVAAHSGGLASLVADPAPYTLSSPGMVKNERSGLWTFA